MGELKCAYMDRTPGSLQSADNRREKRKMSAGERRANAAFDEFDRMWNSVPKANTV